MNDVRPKLTFLDVIIILVPLTVSILVLLGGGSQRPDRVRIITPEGVWRQSLPADTSINLKGSLGPFVIRITGQRVTILTSHCPDHICQGMGPIERAGETMICVPQRIEVRIEGGEHEVDAVCR
jgi:hypothetical protein